MNFRGLTIKIPDFAFKLAEFANLNNQKLYLVGGALRDLLLKKKVYDYDFVCSSSALEFVKFLEAKKKAQIVSLHPKFCTAKIKFKYLPENKELELDLATSRSEFYKFSGALPEVRTPVLIEEDLKRRDFSINALALQIDSKLQKKSSAEKLFLFKEDFIDLFNGIEDLENKKLKVLHQKSYDEDPTRIIRAIRFSARFGYQISEYDCKLIEKVLKQTKFKNFALKIRGPRFGIELERLFELENWDRALELLFDLRADLLFAQDLERKQKKDLKFFIQSGGNLLNAKVRLIWAFWESKSLVVLLKALEYPKKLIKQIEILKLLEANSFSAQLVNLKFFQEKVSADLREFFLILRPAYKKKYSLYQKAEPKVSVQDLIQEKSLKPKEIRSELQKIFENNLKKLGFES